jgi:hypothetical protein
MSTKSLALEEQRSRLERRADVIRSRLLRTIDALDNRRHQVTELGHHAKRMAVPLAASVVGVAIVAAGTTFAIRALVERRRERSFGYRLAKAIAPFRQPPRRPFWQEALRKVTLTALGVIASELVKHGAHGVLQGNVEPLQLGPPTAPPLLGT